MHPAGCACGLPGTLPAVFCSSSQVLPQPWLPTCFTLCRLLAVLHMASGHRVLQAAAACPACRSTSSWVWSPGIHSCKLRCNVSHQQSHNQLLPCHHMPLCCCRLRWNVGHVHLLCYYFPWQREDLTFTCKASYIIGYYAWALAQLMMGILGILIFSWIAFRECHLIKLCWLHTSVAFA